ncbi:MAG: hypothetical protein ACJ71P_09530 [Nitrososphaeraceae archaeon]|jgi:hypothetical protein
MDEEDSVSRSIVKLKNEFIKIHKPRSVVYEIIPLSYSPTLPIENRILSRLNDFAESNLIYYRSSDIDLLGIPCRSYEGDINDYWLSSKKYDANYQPFYPTWILSAYALSLGAKRLGFEEAVDIGSGDGRIAYCSKLIGMKSVGIEIDSALVDLQHRISNLTNIRYDILNEDATNIEYSSIGLSRPMFFISGLPESGEILATSLLTKINEITQLKYSAGFNFMGSHIMKEYTRDKTKWGWGKIIEHFDLDIIECLTLPTLWTNDQQIDTAYVYARCQR